MSRLLTLLRALRRRPTASRVGLRRRTLAQPPKDWDREDQLRAVLVEDPNNIEAFTELADLVRQRTREAQEHKFSGDNLQGEVFRSEEHTSELQSRGHLVCRLLLEKKEILKLIPS